MTALSRIQVGQNSKRNRPGSVQPAGRLIDGSPGETWLLVLQNIRNHIVEPIREAKLKVQNAISGATYDTVSDYDGNFSFGPLPNGTYVLHIEGGDTPSGRVYVSSDELIQVSRSARYNSLLFTRPMGGGCGTDLSLSLEPQTR